MKQNKETQNHNGKVYFYECECGKNTQYGIYRWKDDTDVWQIDACWGGGCNAATDIKYCPYCGRKLKKQ